MREFLPLLVLLSLFSGLTACLDHESKLEDAIRQYVEQREAEVRAACECYQLFINTEDFEPGMFTSEAECLEVLQPAPEDDVVTCMKSLLDSSGHDTKDSVGMMQCYTDSIARTTDCYMQNAGECSPSACSSDVDTPDECQGALTDSEAEALYWCSVR